MAMTLHEMNSKYRISLRKLARMASDGALNVAGDKTSRRPNAMRYYLRQGRHLNVEHCVALLRDPEIFASLGPYENAARKQIKALGDVASEALPENAARWLDLAGRGHKAGVEQLAQWIVSIIPDSECNYHYVAVRALYHVPDYLWKDIYGLIARAIINARNHPTLQAQAASQGKTMIFRGKNNFDL